LTLYIWWARRRLASSRTAAFTAFIDDPGEDRRDERGELENQIKETIR